MQLTILKMLGMAPLQGQCWKSTVLGRLMLQRSLRNSSTLPQRKLTMTKTRHVNLSFHFWSLWHRWQSWVWPLVSESTTYQLKISLLLLLCYNKLHVFSCEMLFFYAIFVKSGLGVLHLSHRSCYH